MTSFHEAKNKIDGGLDSGRLVLVVGNCFVKYMGRAASKLTEGDRLLVIKPDGTFLVHQRTKMAAINYQGPGARISTVADASELQVKAERSKPMHEVIEVHFHSVGFVDSFEMKDDKTLKLFGSEKELSGQLMQDLHLIEKGLIPLKKESYMNKGAIDILAEDAAKNLVAIELKRRNAGLDAVTQLQRYVEELQKRKGRRVRGIMCAPAITPNALKMLEQQGFEFFKLDYEVSNPAAKIKGLQKKQKILDEYS